MKKEIKDKLSTLFDETNDINENIVAMTFFMGLFLIFSIAFMFAGALSAFSIYPVISFLMGMIVCLIGAFIFKAHEQGTLTGEQFVNSVSEGVVGVVSKK